MILIIASRYDYQLREAAAASSGFDALSQSVYTQGRAEEAEEAHGQKVRKENLEPGRCAIAGHNRSA